MVNNMQLSKNFTQKEFEDSDYATFHNINNTMGSGELHNARILCENVLQPIRDYYGLPVTITSGYRQPLLNKKVGGAETSQHQYGQAADIKIKGIQTIELFRWIVAFMKFDQCIFEQDKPANGNVLREWVHVSYNEKHNRQQALTRTRIGKMKAPYKPYKG
jgi:zinc D-Ala-D-Ala carboxypeptidase